MTDNVIDLAEHLPEINAEVVESLRIMLAEALAGRLVALAAVYISNEGDAQTVFHIESPLILVGATAMLHKDALDLLYE